MNLIRAVGPISRANLVKKSGIQARTVSLIADQIIGDGFIQELGPDESTGGRRAILLAINPTGLYVVGIEVNDTTIQGVLIDFSATPLATHSLPLNDSSPDSVVEKTRRMVNELSEISSIPRYQIKGLGISLPGIVDARDHEVLYSTPLNWKNVPLGDILSDELSLDVRLVNNAVAGSLWSAFAETNPAPENLLFYLITLKHWVKNENANIGCGIIIDGRSYLGNAHMAGEMSATLPHPLTIAAELIDTPSISTLDELLPSDSGTNFTKVWERFAAHLGSEIGRGIDYINPNMVVVGSDIPELEALIGDQLREEVLHDSVAGILTQVDIDKLPEASPVQFRLLETNSLALGAALPFIQEFSKTPALGIRSLM